MRRSRVSRRIAAPRDAVYAACSDPQRLVLWRAPDGMSASVEPLSADSYRMTLTYAESGPGKTDADSDSYVARFVSRDAPERVVEAIRFESDDPAFAGEMVMTTLLAEHDGGTEVTVITENLPDGVSVGDNDAGTAMALANLARLVE